MTTRRIALYPGAFRPPHANHLAVVDGLLRSGVEEVRVIVSDRGRWVPHRDRVLAPQVALATWRLLLGEDRPNVLVELADGRAVATALRTVRESPAGHHYLLCVGAKDHRVGLGRFAKVSGAIPDGVTAEVVVGAPPVVDCSASALRDALGRGDVAAFARGLPSSLGAPEVERIWQDCLDALISPQESAVGTIRRSLGLPTGWPIEPAAAAGGDRYRVTAPDGSRLVVTCANDAVSDDRRGERADPGGEPTRDRLWVERNALKWLRDSARSAGVAIPTVYRLDRARSTLAVTDVMPFAEPLVSASLSSSRRHEVGRRIGTFLAAAQRPGPPLMRSRPDKDDRAFDRALQRWVDDDDVADESRSNVRPCFGHLAMTIDRILVSGDRVGVVAFDSASSHADPMFDVATLVASARQTGSGLDPFVDGATGAYRAAIDPSPVEVRRLERLVASMGGAGWRARAKGRRLGPVGLDSHGFTERGPERAK